MRASAGGSTVTWRSRVASYSVLWRHVGAMHLSGAVLLLTFVVPPLWLVDAAYSGPPGDPTSDYSPLVLLLVPPLAVSLHVLVQIPAGLLGSWLGGGRRTLARYGVAVGVAAVLSLLLFWSLDDGGGWAGVLPTWGDAMARTAAGLGAYMWVVRPRPVRVNG